MQFSLRLALAAGLFLSFGTAPAFAAMRIGLVAPKAGPYELLGRQMEAGARMAAEALGAELIWIDESCAEGSDAGVARALAEARVGISIGYLCSETLDGGLAPLKASGIAAITISVRAPILMEDALKYGWPLYRMAPSKDAEAQKIVDVILRGWQASAFALVEDGTIYARELAETVRNRLEERGLKATFIDTFRPGQEQQLALVRRLNKAGIGHVFVGGDRNDVAIIARDAAQENMPMTVLGSDTMHAANQPVALPDGVLAVTTPDYRAMPTAADAVARLLSAGVEPEGYVLPAYAATQVAAAAVAADASAAPVLEGRRFGTVIGPIAFTAQHELADNPYRLMEWRGDRFVEAVAGQ